MPEDIEFQFRAAVEALSRWVTSAPIPNSNQEWRDQYLKLDAEVRRLSMKLDWFPGLDAQRSSEVQKLTQSLEVKNLPGSGGGPRPKLAPGLDPRVTLTTPEALTGFGLS
jgi:hypothetical protein